LPVFFLNYAFPATTPGTFGSGSPHPTFVSFKALLHCRKLVPVFRSTDSFRHRVPPCFSFWACFLKSGKPNPNLPPPPCFLRCFSVVYFSHHVFSNLVWFTPKWKISVYTPFPPRMFFQTLFRVASLNSPNLSIRHFFFIF